MRKHTALVLVRSCFLIPLAIDWVSAHGVIGDRFFPATLTIDDPFVADEFSLPTISALKAPASDSVPATRETDYSFDISKRLSPNLGVGVASTYKVSRRGGCGAYHRRGHVGGRSIRFGLAARIRAFCLFGILPTENRSEVFHDGGALFAYGARQRMLQRMGCLARSIELLDDSLWKDSIRY